MMVGSGATIGPARTESPAEWLAAQLRIVAALAKRDVQSRFGESWLAYALSLLAPIVWIGATWLAFYLFGRTSPVYTDVVTFIISGLIPYAMFRYVVTAIGRTRTAVRGLLLFPTITEEQSVAAAAIVEFANGLILFALIAAANFLIFGKGELADPLTFFWGLSLSWGLGATYGYLFVVLARINAWFHQFGQLLLRPSFFLSAVFFTGNELPDRLLDILSWNPLLHAVEIARDGMLFNYQSRVASTAYVLLWIAALAVAGAIANQARRR
jgi:capsular polysaccharide transport system permease protein